MLILTSIVCFICSILMTPLVKKFAFKIGATDKPNHRKVHQRIMPRLGGLAIFISFLVGTMIIRPDEPYTWAVVAGSFVIILTGMFDDMMELSPKLKLLGQIVAALIVIIVGDVQIEFINLPFGGTIEFGYLSIPLTLLWIVGITNAINLIDGLDGLAAGVSSIALLTMAGMALMMGNGFVVVMASILLFSTLGFLVYNFHPAKIFMGDTGALFLGFMISVFSLLGFKNITVISLIIPIIILGVPIADTFFAIIRRKVNKQPLSAPDKSHLHHCLLRMGFSHKQTVLIIYAIASLFGLAALIFSQAKVWGAILVIGVIILAIEIFVESIGLVNKNYQPLLKLITKGAKNR
ncbi:UDP-GlcNAc:undecaprenyl-phosphate GlcNAc-1-phosphate transferase [Bacillus ectoiniformans]|uniref:glycosyltransferase family 4 protein n=1 Tax=Bacillus ectoiniformans TaxID=1494429 RepID=UPI00195DB7C0|nr:MraY family glycosyltransferase [Bacillus ectoiniformans]MBM7649339.1 UDP-GlcNAc:undecaprenyl-phosphate GlcNAc-1-phosphate transferase [Bacillus ectoiniformans]